jgi:predicted nuclease of predicted toxin-antitoxin system
VSFTWHDRHEVARGRDLSPRVVEKLRNAGHDASHVGDHGLLEADDEKILQFALAQDSIIVTADSDFTTMLALAGLAAPSLVFLRSMDRLTPIKQGDLLVANLPTVEHDLLTGAVVSLSSETSHEGRFQATTSARALPTGYPAASTRAFASVGGRQVAPCTGRPWPGVTISSPSGTPSTTTLSGSGSRSRLSKPLVLASCPVGFELH